MQLEGGESLVVIQNLRGLFSSFRAFSRHGSLGLGRWSFNGKCGMQSKGMEFVALALSSVLVWSAICLRECSKLFFVRHIVGGLMSKLGFWFSRLLD
jgi:hypothetical protein